MKRFVSATILSMGLLSFIGDNPALAALVKIGFCGDFGDGSGQINRSFIEIDTELVESDENFGIVDAQISTTRNGSTVEYDFEDLTESGQGFEINNSAVSYVFDGGESFYWSFFEGLNNFNVVVPVPFFNAIIDGDDSPFDIVDNSEFRPDLRFAKDPDVIRVVPEPLTILGSFTAIGFGMFFKKKTKES